MSQSPRIFKSCLLLSAVLALAAAPADATNYNLSTMLANPGFESGMTNWNYTGAGVNPNTYLTNSEWSSQFWSASSPFYTDAALATYYPGRPWAVDPNITHIDQTGVPGDATTVIGAALGLHFIGSRQDGYEGHYRRHSSEPPQPAGGFYDTNFQVTSDAISGSFLAGDTFTLKVYGVRGRLNQDWGQANANTPGSASTLSARLTGGTFVTPSFNFTSWTTDGIWASQTFTWQLQSNASSIRVVVTGQNGNHDRFVAVDLEWEPSLPTEQKTWGAIKALYRD
jgi:hypothetical protein